MRQKVQPGIPLEVVTPEELVNHLRDNTETLLKRLGKNAIFKRVVITGQSDNNGVVTIEAEIPDGFMWSVMAVIVTGNSAANPNLGMYINDPTTLSNLVANIATTTSEATPQVVFFSKNQVVAHSTDQLWFHRTGTTANALWLVTMHVIEVPSSHEAQLLL